MDKYRLDLENRFFKGWDIKIFEPNTVKKMFPDQNLAIYENKILKTNIFFVKTEFF